MEQSKESQSESVTLPGESFSDGETKGCRGWHYICKTLVQKEKNPHCVTVPSSVYVEAGWQREHAEQLLH